MFSKILSSFIAALVCSTVVLAGPAPKAVKVQSIDSYIAEVARASGRAEGEVRKEAVEALRKEGKFKAEELERISRGKAEFDALKHREYVTLLKNNKNFQARVGVAASRNSKIEAAGSKAFAEVKTVEAKPAAKKVEAVKKAEPTVMEKRVMALGRVKELMGKEVYDTLLGFKEADAYMGAERLALILAKRVASKKPGQHLDAVEATKLFMNNYKSKQIIGDYALGEGASEACLNMEAKAVENLSYILDGGVSRGKDLQTFMEGMGENAGKLFNQKLEEGIARVCALASGPCKTFSAVIMNACKSIKAI